MESINKGSERGEVTQNRGRMIERRLGWGHILVCSLLVFGLVILPYVGGTAQEQSAYERALARRLAALEYKLQYVTGGPNEVVITGATLRIVNGLGETDTTNGLGNLIVGYNEGRGDLGTDNRTGSHNIVVGRQNNFSSFGGLVGGQFNEISGDFASVSGGSHNSAGGQLASVSGGTKNMANGEGSSVSGGNANRASGLVSSVSGGQRNEASGIISSVSGGDLNEANGDGSSVSGGQRNVANGRDSSVSGGLDRVAPDRFNWAAGPLFAAQ